MALTCSLLGHAFDDYEVVRDREERGSEVVTQVREVAVCDRCGAERTLSENTEVTSIVDAPPLDTDDTDDTDETGDEDGGEEEFFSPDDTETTTPDLGPDGTTTAPEATADDPVPDEGAELVENDGPSDVGGLDDTTASPADVEDTTVVAGATPTDGDAIDSAAEASVPDEGDDGAEVAATGSQDGDPDDGDDEDDAVILTDSPEEREYGEWPSHDGQQYQPWNPDRLLDDPDREEGDDGPTVAEVMGTNGHDGGDDGEDESDGGDGPAFEETAAVTDGDALLSCPNCGFQSPLAAVSLRRGDACPDCRAGYLVTERNP